MIRGRKGNGSGEVAGAMKRDTRAWEPDPLDHGGLGLELINSLVLTIRS
jgi:hypothetical protein